jgi:hypothetical protein
MNGRDYMGDVGVNRKLIFNRGLNKEGVSLWIGLIESYRPLLRLQ